MSDGFMEVPTVAAMAAEAWNQADTEHPDEAADTLSEKFNELLAHLTDHGQGQFFEEMQAAMDRRRQDGPGAIAEVFTRWWNSLVLRHQPGFLEALDAPWPEAGGPYESTASLRTAFGL
jgi:hypothetical protein